MSITWDFYETGCVADVAGFDSCILPLQPFVLASLTLPSQNSSGSAMWAGNGGYPEPPVYTGDAFSFAWPGMAPGVSQAFTGTPGCMTLSLCDFHITWSEVTGQLAAVSVTIDGFTDGIERLGLTAGKVEAMTMLAGCHGTCDVSGFWAVPVATPEPASIALLAIALVSALWAGRNSGRWRKIAGCK